MEAAAAEAPAAKKQRVKRSNPPGIIFNEAKDKYQARIKGMNDKGKLVQIDRPIPGLFASVDLAREAQAAAQIMQDAGEAVWLAPPGERNARGQGKKLPPCWTYGKKKWNRGAPLSKKATGVGRVKKATGASGSNDEVLETVPLPAARDQITVECMREFLVDPPTAGAEIAVHAWAPGLEAL